MPSKKAGLAFSFEEMGEGVLVLPNEIEMWVPESASSVSSAADVPGGLAPRRVRLIPGSKFSFLGAEF